MILKIDGERCKVKNQAMTHTLQRRRVQLPIYNILYNKNDPIVNEMESFSVVLHEIKL